MWKQLHLWGGRASIIRVVHIDSHIPSHLLVYYFIYQIGKEYDKNLLSLNLKQNMKHFYFWGVLLGPYIKSMGTGEPKCQQMQASSQWRHKYVQQGKQLQTSFSYMDLSRFLYIPLWGNAVQMDMRGLVRLSIALATNGQQFLTIYHSSNWSSESTHACVILNSHPPTRGF